MGVSLFFCLVMLLLNVHTCVIGLLDPCRLKYFFNFDAIIFVVENLMFP